MSWELVAQIATLGLVGTLCLGALFTLWPPHR